MRIDGDIRKAARRRAGAWAFAAAACLTGPQGALAGEENPLDYVRDVRPILAANCFHCHGADPQTRQADLRLDQFESTDDATGADGAIVPGDVENSELVVRIESEDADLHMPPADSGKVLKPEQIALLKRWIMEGAPYRQHWAFVAPVRPAVPDVAGAPPQTNPIDAFVDERLKEEDLHRREPAAAATLLRRMALDLTGLPPTWEEVEAYARDPSPEAYAAAVERLLASAAYGERWAQNWLDGARYSDSDGFEKDKPREMWLYRDWVINALNADMPFDQFVLEQLAGDLLPDAAPEQQMATGFLRNSMLNEEGGIDPEQFRMEAMYDRMDAIGKSILGLTVQCAQCHSHKYDPLTQTDYYRLFAYLNNCDEAQVAAYTPAERKQWRRTEQVIQAIEAELQQNRPGWRQEMDKWAESVRGDQPAWTILRPKPDSSGDQKNYVLPDGSILAQGYAPTFPTSEFVIDVTGPPITAIQVELLNDPNLPKGGPGRSFFGTCALTEFWASAAPLSDLDDRDDLQFVAATADVNPPETPLAVRFDDLSGRRRVTGPIGMAIDGSDLTAWGIDVGPGRSNVPRKAVFTLSEPLDCRQGVQLKVQLAQYHGGWNSDEHQNNNLGRYRLSATTTHGVAADPLPAAVRAIVEKPSSERTPDDVKRLFAHWRTLVPQWSAANARIDALWQSHPEGTTQLVLHERTDRRPTHRLERGNFLSPAEEVTPGVPKFLHPLPSGAGNNRIALARWLTDRRSPTTARALVNKIWQSYFGVGLVATAEDLGSQGDAPSHPELLDWLAVELMDSGWKLKHIHRLIVSSATYRQSSRVTEDLAQRDPDNRLLARGPRFRMSGEAVRDVALAASGLLYDKVGGPSVFTPAPKVLFEPPATFAPKTWTYEAGPQKYRRALYTFRYRTAGYPALENFDVPKGEVPCVRRIRSNTPLQALTTLNEALFFECAQALADRTLAACGDDAARGIEFVYQQCLGRAPHSEEASLLAMFLERQRERFAADQDAATKVVSPLPPDGAGEEEAKEQAGAGSTAGAAPDPEPVASATASPAADATRRAAWTALCRVVLNLDETITKE